MVNVECNVVDAGARYGIHPSWNELVDIANFYLFEVDLDETVRLIEKYKSKKNIKVYKFGLGKIEGGGGINIVKHHGLNSTLDINMQLRQKHNFMVEEAEYINKEEVDIVSIDNFFLDDVHFLKIDTEGTELDVLLGAQEKLVKSILGIRCEVSFVEVYKNQYLFGDINKYLNEKGFELLNFEYDGRGHPRSKYTLPDRYGVLISTDAVWVKKEEIIFNHQNLESIKNIIRYTLFLMLNSATDFAIDILHKSVNCYKINFKDFKDEALFKKLDKMVQILFKKISYLPYVDTKELEILYKKIFEKDLKKMHEFYESNIAES